MSTHTLTPLVQHLHAFASRPADRSDDELLRAFSAERDEAAFAAIVRRYGGLVLGVCRRTLRHEQDAEDAFQATFLVLARGAGGIRKGQSLASWLHGVSYRVALKARLQSSRRREVQTRACRPESATPADELTWAEVRGILDEEVGRLPTVYREAFVLCGLQGASRAEAAARLNVKEGTLSSRLAQGRKRLQEALAKRGVALGSLPAPFVPQVLLRKAIDIISLSADALPEPIARLATASTTSWAKVAALMMLAALLTAAGVLATTSQTAAEKPAVHAAKEEPAGVEVKGQVLDPAGKPVSGAKLTVFRTAEPDLERPALATTDKDGRFAFSLPAKESRGDVKLVASAKGFAAAWQDLAPAKEMTMKLRPDDVTLTGKLVSLEGRPLEGVPVQLSWIGEHPGDKVGDWINHFLERHSKGYWINEDGLRILRPQALGLPRTVTTGKDGTFHVKGAGRDRVVTLVFRGERTVTARVQVALREGPKAGWVKGDYGLFAPGFTFVLGPCKPIVGTVRDKKSGKPVAGMTVSGGRGHTQVRTDEKGEYRLFGEHKQTRYMIALGGRKGVPYIDHTVHDVADTMGLEPLKVDFELERGVEISGRVFDKATGKPVRGSVSYFYSTTNPHVKDFTTLEGAKFIISDWGKIAEDGSFTVLGIPGPGALVVRARNSTDYVQLDARGELAKLKSRAYPIGATHGYVAFDVDEANPKSHTHTIGLTPAVRRLVKLVDSEGKPVVGAVIVGHSDDEKRLKLTTSEMTMRGLRAGHSRALVAIAEGVGVGAVAAVNGDSDKPVEVRLQALGTLTGRLVNEEGSALPGRSVRLYLWLDAKKFENLPTEHRVERAFSLVDGSWSEFTSREGITDKEGRFRLTGLIPGQRYDLIAGDGKLSTPEQVTHTGAQARVEPGKMKDVGDVKPRKER